MFTIVFERDFIDRDLLSFRDEFEWHHSPWLSEFKTKPHTFSEILPMLCELSETLVARGLGDSIYVCNEETGEMFFVDENEEDIKSRSFIVKFDESDTEETLALVELLIQHNDNNRSIEYVKLDGDLIYKNTKVESLKESLSINSIPKYIFDYYKEVPEDKFLENHKYNQYNYQRAELDPKYKDYKHIGWFVLDYSDENDYFEYNEVFEACDYNGQVRFIGFVPYEEGWQDENFYEMT